MLSYTELSGSWYNTPKYDVTLCRARRWCSYVEFLLESEELLVKPAHDDEEWGTTLPSFVDKTRDSQVPVTLCHT